MNLKLENIQKYGIHLLIVIILSIPPGYFNWSEYKDINEARLLLKDEINQFEKYKNIKVKELEYERSQFEKYKNIKTSKKDNQKNSSNTVKNEIENNVNQLINKFTDLGINLSHIDWCDKNYANRYNQASTILSHISTLISKYKFLNKYNQFVFKNRSHKIDLTGGKCKKDYKPLIIK